jgi:hypothetical protein
MVKDSVRLIIIALIKFFQKKNLLEGRFSFIEDIWKLYPNK